MFTVHFHSKAVKVYSATKVPYPSKTNRQVILDAALKQIEREGYAKLSLRSIASSLHLAPNALYRYFSDRAELEAAIAEEGASRLHAAMAHACKGNPEQMVQRAAKAYVDFARRHPAIYDVLMRPRDLSEKQLSTHNNLWNFVVKLMSGLAGSPRSTEAAVALWAFLHGIVTLDQAHVHGPQKPPARAALAYGLEAFLAGVSRVHTIDQ